MKFQLSVQAKTLRLLMFACIAGSITLPVVAGKRANETQVLYTGSQVHLWCEKTIGGGSDSIVFRVQRVKFTMSPDGKPHVVDASQSILPKKGSYEANDYHSSGHRYIQNVIVGDETLPPSTFEVYRVTVYGTSNGFKVWDVVNLHLLKDTLTLKGTAVITDDSIFSVAAAVNEKVREYLDSKLKNQMQELGTAEMVISNLAGSFNFAGRGIPSDQSGNAEWNTAFESAMGHTVYAGASPVQIGGDPRHSGYEVKLHAHDRADYHLKLTSGGSTTRHIFPVGLPQGYIPGKGRKHDL